jgi:hypothetical protein
VCNNLVQVVSDGGFCDRADVALPGLEHVGVVGRKDGRSGANYRAQGVVHLLRVRLVDVGLEDGALRGCGGGRGHGRVRGEVVVVVGGSAYNGALVGGQLVSYTYDIGKDCLEARVFGAGYRGEHTFWPSFVKSTSGWFGGRTSVVVPMTGQDMVDVGIR